MAMIAIKGYENRYSFDTEKNAVYSLLSLQYLKWYGDAYQVKLYKYTGDPWPRAFNINEIKGMLAMPSGKDSAPVKVKANTPQKDWPFPKEEKRTFIVFYPDEGLNSIEDFLHFPTLEAAREAALECDSTTAHILEVVETLKMSAPVWKKGYVE